jgi:hypothetical protein
MKGQTLMLITDISGYTRFITKVGHEEGLRKAKDLLQIIINENSLGLKLCEIEGDAVFFYSMRSLPSRTALMRQIRKTYQAFNHYLQVNELGEELGIKFFVHTGLCEEIQIGGRTKLYGMEVIKIHRLLKSIVNKDDYLLVTSDASALLEFDHEVSTSGQNEFAYIGSVEYSLFNERYLQLPVKETNLYHTLLEAISESAITVSRELTRQYRLYSGLLNAWHS